MVDLTTHTGSMLSGQIVCTCGFTTRHYALAVDAIEEFDAHLADKGVKS